MAVFFVLLAFFSLRSEYAAKKNNNIRTVIKFDENHKDAESHAKWERKKKKTSTQKLGMVNKLIHFHCVSRRMQITFRVPSSAAFDVTTTAFCIFLFVARTTWLFPRRWNALWNAMHIFGGLLFSCRSANDIESNDSKRTANLYANMKLCTLRDRHRHYIFFNNTWCGISILHYLVTCNCQLRYPDIFQSVNFFLHKVFRLFIDEYVSLSFSLSQFSDTISLSSCILIICKQCLLNIHNLGWVNLHVDRKSVVQFVAKKCRALPFLCALYY